MDSEVVFKRFVTIIYCFAAAILTLMSVLIMGWSVYEVVVHIISQPKKLDTSFISTMLSAVGTIVIAVAILDVAKYMIEEEVLRNKELHTPREAREALTKIMVIICIAVSIEGLIFILKAGTTDMTLLVYPALLMFAAVVIMVGLGVFQKISLQAEKD